MPYITPDGIPTDYVVRRLVIPNNTYFLGAVNGALCELEDEANWEQVDGISVEDTVALAKTMIEGYFDQPMLLGTVAIVALATLPPTSLICDGTTYNRVDYPNLYAVIHPDLIVDADTFTVPALGGGSNGVNFVIFY